MDKRIEVSTTNVYVAKIILGSVIDRMVGVKEYIYKVDEYASSQVVKSESFSDLANLLEFANDLASEIVRVESWEDEDDV